MLVDFNVKEMDFLTGGCVMNYDILAGDWPWLVYEVA